MTIEAEIQALLADIAPLRALPEDESEAAGLPRLIDRVNALRAVQALSSKAVGETVDAINTAEASAVAEDVNRPRRGRPPKGAAE